MRVSWLGAAVCGTQINQQRRSDRKEESLLVLYSALRHLKIASLRATHSLSHFQLMSMNGKVNGEQAHVCVQKYTRLPHTCENGNVS